MVPKSPEFPHSISAESAVNALKSDGANGLTDREASNRLAEHGPNLLRQRKRRSAWLVLLDQLRSLVVLLLVGAALLSLFLQDWPEFAAILVVIVINTAIGFFTEIKALHSMEALYRLGTVETRVRRGGHVLEVPATNLVPGDIVLLEGGDIVTADMRVIEASKLQCDESALTGESMPVTKNAEAVPEDTVLAERVSMLYKGTAITRGACAGVVVATGMDTELGRISALVEGAEEESTPLEKRLERLGKRLVWVILGITTLVAGLGVLRGKDLVIMIETGIALAVASIPEGLPIVATIALSRGMLRMARRQALVSRLSSVETLGSTDVICTDKTGTLTENRMTVQRIVMPGFEFERNDQGVFTAGGDKQDAEQQKMLRRVLEIGVLCNNAALPGDDEDAKASGDPLEIALLSAGSAAQIDRDALIEEHREQREISFDTDTKMMATFHDWEGRYRVAVKGAPESVFDACTDIVDLEGARTMDDGIRTEWEQCNASLAAEGFRVLALAEKMAGDCNEPAYEGLTLVALLALLDPPRTDIRETIRRCKDAGIRIVMVTGDQPDTAAYVAKAVGITDEDVPTVLHGRDLKAPDTLTEREADQLRSVTIFARVNPGQKLDLIALHQEQGHVVAMTGDGVNDAPALKKADIGIAMGQRGTQVARQVADVILKDDAFATIVYAVQEGRIIFGNIRKFVLYLMSCNVAEILVIFLASIINTALPIHPLQILFLNLVTDIFPALALGVGEGDPAVMKQPPRPPGESILTRRHWTAIGVYGLIIALSTLSAFLLSLRYFDWGVETSVTVAFLTLAFAQLWHVINMRDKGMPLFRNDVTRNPFVWGALVLCIVLVFGAVYIPGAGAVLYTVPLTAAGWMLVLPASFVPVAAGLFLVRRL